MYRPVQERRTWGRMEGRCRREETTSARERSNARVSRSWSARSAREFSVICFAWDGTAVARRDADASAVRSRVERLTALGVDIAIISSADVAEVDAQLHARPGVEGRLFLHLSRGSEIYVVGPAGPRLLERREATSLEEEQARRDRRGAPRPSGRRRARRGSGGGPPQPAVRRPGARLAGAARRQRRGAPAPGRRAAPRGRFRRRPHRVHGARTRDRPGRRPLVPGRDQRRPAHRHRPHGQGGRHARGDPRPGAGARAAAAGPARAGRHLRADGGRAGDRLRDAHPRAAPRRVHQRRRGAGGRAAAGAARRRRPGRTPRHPARPARDA